MPVRHEGTTAALTDKSWNSRLISAGCRQVCITTDHEPVRGLEEAGERGPWGPLSSPNSSCSKQTMDPPSPADLPKE